MRYFIEVKPLKSPVGTQIHAQDYYDSWLTICRRWIMQAKEVDASVTCKKCLAILEKRGRVEP